MRSRCASLLAAAVLATARAAYAQSGVPQAPYSPSATELALEPSPPPSPPRPAKPPEAAPKRFGDAGTVVLTGMSSLAFSTTQFDGSPAESTTLVLSPGVDVFVIDRVSVGIDLTYTHGHSRGYAYDNNVVTYDGDSFGAGARLSLDLPLGPYVSWYLRATLGFGSSSTKMHAQRSFSINGATINDGTIDVSSTYVVAFLPLVAHIAPHAFVGLGPRLSRDLSKSVNQGSADDLGTSLGAALVVGAWL